MTVLLILAPHCLRPQSHVGAGLSIGCIMKLRSRTHYPKFFHMLKSKASRTTTGNEDTENSAWGCKRSDCTPTWYSILFQAHCLLFFFISNSDFEQLQMFICKGFQTSPLPKPMASICRYLQPRANMYHVKLSSCFSKASKVKE